MKLYYIDDDQRELFVWAGSPEQAIDHWREYFDTEGEENPEKVFIVPHKPPSEGGALGWHRQVSLVHEL